ncbi:tyrosine-type recombinase/integrase [Coralloluteibacterium thermophilus]|uniref:Tyrosine-type recombinase/integrase n=1 Tax=Coralloluteibacterium thermophilum TaxID=2707049 RepID=A0ABV9NL41_9GAMM
MPVKKRANGSYQVTICFGGRTLRKASRHWSYQDAKHFERQWLASVKDAAAGREPERLIEEALERWLTEHVPRLASARQTRNHCRMLLPFIRGRKLTEAPQVWAEVKAAMQGKAAATVNHKGRILRQVCRAALLEWGWMDRPVAINLLAETPRERFLTTEEVERLAAACLSDEAAGYVMLAAYTGIRRGHLLRLTHHDVQGDFIRLDRSSKTRTLQMVPLHPKVRELAKRLPLGIGDRRLKEEWTAARAATGIDCRWHDLRHTCASWLVQAGVPLYVVGEFLGHSSPTVTKRYAHLSPQQLVDAISRIA